MTVSLGGWRSFLCFIAILTNLVTDSKSRPGKTEYAYYQRDYFHWLSPPFCEFPFWFLYDRRVTGLRSAPVGAKRMSTGYPAPSVESQPPTFYGSA